jgi:hypothetical protein
MCFFNLRQESWREPIEEVSARATNDNSAREIGIVYWKLQDVIIYYWTNPEKWKQILQTMFLRVLYKKIQILQKQFNFIFLKEYLKGTLTLYYEHRRRPTGDYLLFFSPSPVG